MELSPMPTLVPYIRHLKTVALLTDYTLRIYWVGKDFADQSCKMCVFPARCYHPMVTPGINIWADTSHRVFPGVFTLAHQAAQG